MADEKLEQQGGVADETNLDMFSGLGLSEEEINALNPANTEKEETQEEEAQEEEVVETENTEEETQEEEATEEEEQTEETQEETQEEEDEIENPFVKKKATKAPEADLKDVKIDNIDKLSTLFKETGLEIKDVNDLSKVPAAFIEMKEKLSTIESDVQELSSFKTVFQSLPPDVFDVVETWLNDGDYRKVMGKHGGSYVDFGKSFEENDLKNVMEHYYPGKFTEDDYDEIDDDPRMKALVDTVQSRFTADKETITGKRQKYLENLESSKVAFKESFTNTLEELKKEAFVNDSISRKVSDVLKNGTAGVLSLFFDKDGNLLPSAAKQVAMNLYGEQALDYYQKLSTQKAVKKAVSDNNKDLVSRGTGKKKTGGKVSNQEIDKNTQEVLDKIIPKPVNTQF